MAGHSKFKNIMHRKGAQDAKRSKLFSKLSREITVAAKMGTPDPDMNPRLRLAIQAAKAQSVPKDNIERAIKKASTDEDANYDEVRYEGYGPGGVAVLVEALTDNRNRTASIVRAAFSKHGGALGETGSVAFMFDRVGEIEYPASAADADTVMEAAIEAGADNVVSDEEFSHHHLRLRGRGRGFRRPHQAARRPRLRQHRLAPADQHAGRRGEGRHADEADRRAGRRRRRAERLRQLRDQRRDHGKTRGCLIATRPATI